MRSSLHRIAGGRQWQRSLDVGSEMLKARTPRRTRTHFQSVNRRRPPSVYAGASDLNLRKYSLLKLELKRELMHAVENPQTG